MDSPKEKKEKQVNFNKPPTVVPVKDLPRDPRIKPTHPNFIQAPALLLGIGAVKSGKTVLINNMLLRPYEDGFFGQDYFDESIIISNTINNDPTARFLKKSCSVIDYYTDGVISDLVSKQDGFGEKENMPFISLICDDILGSNMKRNNEISFLATRFRHKNIGLMGVFVQNFKSVDTILRNNATDVIIFKQSNNKQLEQIAEEYCSMFGDKTKFYEVYKKAVKKKYDFLYLKVQEGLALRSFEEILWNTETDLDDNHVDTPEEMESKEGEECKDCSDNST